jgi:hypothetical protein
MTQRLLAEVDVGAPGEEAADDKLRRRVSGLIRRAEQAAEAGSHGLAVAALDVALSQEPDSAITQKTVHRHRELMFRIFEGFLGDMHAVPTLALPLQEVSTQDLDSRAAFLLSRVDGTLSFEEIMDVAGMSRLEAYRHLCRLLLRGILEIR